MQPDDPRHQHEQEMRRQRRKRAQLAELHGISLTYVDAEPIRRHSLQLEALGWTGQAIVEASRCGGTVQGLRLIQRAGSLTAHPKWRRILRLPLTVAVPNHLPDHMLVPALGAQRRTHALMALGYRHSDLTEAYGGAISSHLSIGLHPVITARTWRAVDAAFRRLEATPGPSERARARAVKQGFAPPAAWDDVDDPNEQPKGITRPNSLTCSECGDSFTPPPRQTPKTCGPICRRTRRSRHERERRQTAA